MAPLLWQIVLVEDRADGTLRFARSAADARLGIDVEPETGSSRRCESADLVDRSRPVDGVDGAKVDARSVAGRFAGLGNDVGHAVDDARSVPHEICLELGVYGA